MFPCLGCSVVLSSSLASGILAHGSVCPHGVSSPLPLYVHPRLQTTGPCSRVYTVVHPYTSVHPRHANRCGLLLVTHPLRAHDMFTVDAVPHGPHGVPTRSGSTAGSASAMGTRCWCTPRGRTATT